MLKLGIISELGTGKNLGFARVSFDDVGLPSYWLPLPSFRTKNVKVWVPLEINTQIACLMDDYCEQGYIVGALWSDTDRPPEWADANSMGIQFADDVKFFYDAKKSELIIDAPNSALNMRCKNLNITGDVDVSGEVVVSKDVTAGVMGIKLTTHKHPTPAGVSGPPTP